MINLIEDIATLSGVSELTLRKLLPVAEYSLLNSVYETIQERNPLTTVDLEFGTLQIYINNDKILYKFVPSKEFEKRLLDLITSNKNPILSKLEHNIQKKIEKTYRELL